MKKIITWQAIQARKKSKKRQQAIKDFLVSVAIMAGLVLMAGLASTPPG